MEAERDSQWSWEENKVFENALAQLDHHSPDLFQQIALRLPGKNPSHVQKHYSDLVGDVLMIESDLVPPPNYTSSPSDAKEGAAKRPRKRGVPWTTEEHQLFLMGLEKYGKGDWRSISRNCVVSRTPAQVASHAQKYFIRLQNSHEKSSTITAAAAAAGGQYLPSPPYTSLAQLP